MDFVPAQPPLRRPPTSREHFPPLAASAGGWARLENRAKKCWPNAEDGARWSPPYRKRADNRPPGPSCLESARKRPVLVVGRGGFRFIGAGAGLPRVEPCATVRPCGLRQNRATRTAPTGGGESPLRPLTPRKTRSCLAHGGGLGRVAAAGPGEWVRFFFFFPPTTLGGGGFRSVLPESSAGSGEPENSPDNSWLLLGPPTLGPVLLITTKGPHHCWNRQTAGGT